MMPISSEKLENALKEGIQTLLSQSTDQME